MVEDGKPGATAPRVALLCGEGPLGAALREAIKARGWEIGCGDREPAILMVPDPSGPGREVFGPGAVNFLHHVYCLSRNVQLCSLPPGVSRTEGPVAPVIDKYGNTVGGTYDQAYTFQVSDHGIGITKHRVV